MLGDDSITLDLNDQLTDKDWAQYAEGPKKDGVVVFFDRVQYAPWDWWWEGFKRSLDSGRPVQQIAGQQRQQSASTVLQPAMDGQRLMRRGLSPRESMVGQSRRSWDGKGAQKNGPLRAQSMPRSRRESPVNGHSPLGVPKPDPAPANGGQRKILPPVSMHPGRSEGIFLCLRKSTIGKPVCTDMSQMTDGLC